MKHHLHHELFINADLDQVWDFFSDARNLSQLTPEKMNMKVISKLSKFHLYEGMKIAYYVSPLFKLPLRWDTTITKVEEKKMFIDIQTKGPFKSWVHLHRFKNMDGGVLIIDDVDYELPFGKFGEMFHKPLVQNNLKELFAYRQIVCQSIFESKGQFLDRPSR